MKTIKIFLSAILIMMAITIQAQSVWIYKSDGTKVAYDASLIKSIEYAKFCTIEGVTLLEDYNIDEGKHTFSESLITSEGPAIPSEASVQYGVVNTSDKMEIPTKWGDASNAVASSDGIWQVWAKVTPTNNNGYKEDIIRIGEVIICETDYGYYREADDWRNQNSASGWVKLSSANQVVQTGKEVNMAIATVNNVKPTLTAGIFDFQVFSAQEGGFSQKITINGKQYYFWITAEILSAVSSVTIKQ